MENKLGKGKQEAEATIRKSADGHYVDLSKDTLTAQGITNLTEEQMIDLFSKLRLRYSLTPQCNIWCTFCSNEGSNYTSKTLKSADTDLVIRLSEMLLNNTPLRSIDFSGGEPTLHPDFFKEEFRIVEWTKAYPDIRFSLHSNAIELNPNLVDRIKDNFSRIGVSINSVIFDTWNRMTNLCNIYPEKAQRRKFDKIIGNLEYIANQNIGYKVFMKSVIMHGFNDSEEELSAFLDACAKYNFHPKFLQFDPQYASQRPLQVERKELFAKLEKLGCEFPKDTPRHNDPNTYIPGVNFEFLGAQTGLHSIFGCGDKAACLSCYSFLCMFVKPSGDGEGLYLKPCSVLDTRIDLTHAIKSDNTTQLLNLFRLSREYLMLTPGMGTEDWHKEKKYES